MTSEPMFWNESQLPKGNVKSEKNFQSLKHPVWTEEKAKLIQEYVKLFTYVTKHGAYIDGFAAPQQRDRLDMCSAKLVLENKPEWVRNFWLCDKDPNGVSILEDMANQHRNKKRHISVLCGDFNETVDQILLAEIIKAKTATFALLDQRTFECSWATVKKLADHKQTLDPTAMKIEIFYFLASGWLDRSIAAVKRPQTATKLDRWWGRNDWSQLRDIQGIARAKLLAQRFKDEFGYKHVYPYAIHDRGRNGRTMYHMIHATDHDEAPPLMLRAYRKISGRSDIDMAIAQSDMDKLWTETQDES
jgi:three-Cys-motif partner protein